MGAQIIPSPSTLAGPVTVNGAENVSMGLTAAFLQTGSAFIAMVEENNGGRLRFQKSIAADANPGVDQLKLYVRDGTVGGTLKLVARAGAAGAETAILDNIPQ